MTWQEIQDVIEAQGVTADTVIHAITIEAGKPIVVVIDPDDPEAVTIKDTD